MKLALSTIALGISLACASHVASSQTITLTQQGSGNTAAAEQAALGSVPVIDPSATTASITQIGTNNHVGGPGATSGGIFQNVFDYGAVAVVSQTGAGNNAGITQNGRSGPEPGPVQALITQHGNGNDATITQTNALTNYINVEQSGSANLARLEQLDSGDASLHVTQNGTGNTTAITHLNSDHGGPDVTQTGDRNTVSLFVDSVSGTGATITQNGSMNNANARLIGAGPADLSLTLSQQGVGNSAGSSQTGEVQSANINQIGNNNLVSLIQGAPAGGITGNSAAIAQIGNNNSATVGQYGQGYVASVNQAGSGNWANVYQH